LDGNEEVEGYKDWYKEKFGFPPTEKLINRFCEIRGIKMKREEVTKVEEIKQCSVLNDVPVVTNDTSSVINPNMGENYKALETTYQNLLAEHQEVCAIALEQKQTIEADNALIVKLSTNMGKLLNIVDYHKDLMSPSDIKKLEEIKKEVEGS
jgi:hypothetical protein